MHVSSLCSQKQPSILRKTKAKQLQEFSERKCEELKTRAPTLHGCIRSVTTSSKKRRKIEKGSNNDEQNDAAPISLAASIVLLKQRCPQTSAIAYRFSLGVLWHSGAKKQVPFLNK